MKIVVIPKKTITHVFELNDEEFNKINNGSLPTLINSSNFKRIENTQCINDDEISIEDCGQDKIYAYYNSDLKRISVIKMLKHNCYKIVNLSSLVGGWGDVIDKGDLPEILKRVIDIIQSPLYQFDNQKEFFEWGYKILNGEDN